MSNIKHKNVQRGYPLPRGTTSFKDGINFSLFSRHATSVTLVIKYHSPKHTDSTTLFFPLDPQENRTGDMWHILLQTEKQLFTYGYQIRHDGEKTTKNDTILIDPYAHSLLPRSWVFMEFR